jgi:ribosomal protein L40E
MSADYNPICPRCRATNHPDATTCRQCGAALHGSGRRPRRRRATLEGAILALIILTLLATLILGLYALTHRALNPTVKIDPYEGRSGTTATTSLTSSGSSDATKSTSTTLPMIQIRPKAATASSALKATNMRDFGPTNLVDSDFGTAWIEGAEGPGLGEWVKFEFTEPTVLGRIDIANGHQQDEHRFEGNARVKTIRIEYSDGSNQLVDLFDSKDLQSIDPLPLKTEWIRLAVISVHPGHIWPDTAITEVRMYALIDQG